VVCKHVSPDKAHESISVFIWLYGAEEQFVFAKEPGLADVLSLLVEIPQL
jgi:hypothetical protein